MGDGAREISKAGREVFGDTGIRLMCWPHTNRYISVNLITIKANKSIIISVLNSGVSFMLCD